VALHPQAGSRSAQLATEFRRRRWQAVVENYSALMMYMRRGGSYLPSLRVPIAAQLRGDRGCIAARRSLCETRLPWTPSTAQPVAISERHLSGFDRAIALSPCCRVSGAETGIVVPRARVSR
jgi:hypothetical protein